MSFLISSPCARALGDQTQHLRLKLHYDELGELILKLLFSVGASSTLLS